MVAEDIIEDIRIEEEKIETKKSSEVEKEKLIDSPDVYTAQATQP